jgi:hypothetical protein
MVISMTRSPLQLLFILIPTDGRALTNINGMSPISFYGEDANSKKINSVTVVNSTVGKRF